MRFGKSDEVHVYYSIKYLVSSIKTGCRFISL